MRSALIHASPGKQDQATLTLLHSTLAQELENGAKPLGNVDRYSQAQLRLHVLNHQHRLTTRGVS